MPAIRTAGVQIEDIPRYSGSGIPKLKKKRIKQSEELEVEQNEDAVEKEHLETVEVRARTRPGAFALCASTSPVAA